MRFGIYVHIQGPSAFHDVASNYGRLAAEALANVALSEIDALFLSFQSTSMFESGIRGIKRRVRRDVTYKLITGGTVHHNCCIELNALVADAEVIDAASEPALFEYVRALVLKVLPSAFKGFPEDEHDILRTTLASIALAHEPRW